MMQRYVNGQKGKLFCSSYEICDPKPADTFYMKYAVNAGRISSVVKIVNFVRQARAKDQSCPMAVILRSVLTIFLPSFSRCG